MKVRATGRAQREIVRAALWWKANRPAAPDLFLEELQAAERHLCGAPISGEVYGYRKARLIRRWLLQETEYHVYFSVDREARVIMVHSVGGGLRGSDWVGPPLAPRRGP